MFRDCKVRALADCNGLKLGLESDDWRKLINFSCKRIIEIVVVSECEKEFG